MVIPLGCPKFGVPYIHGLYKGFIGTLLGYSFKGTHIFPSRNVAWLVDWYRNDGFFNYPSTSSPPQNTLKKITSPSFPAPKPTYWHGYDRKSHWSRDMFVQKQHNHRAAKASGISSQWPVILALLWIRTSLWSCQCQISPPGVFFGYSGIRGGRGKESDGANLGKL